MPVYEYYCSDCHTIYSFRADSFNETKKPTCPECGTKKLKKQISLFAISKGQNGGEGDDECPNLDETAIERAMHSLENEAGSLDEQDPRAVARFVRKLYGSTGLELGEGMEEAICRMEAGEDPDKIEEQMGDSLEADEVLFANKADSGKVDLQAVRRKLLPPKVDETLYDL